MQVYHVRTAGTLVQIIYVLGDDRYIEIPLQVGNAQMPGIRHHIEQLLATFVIEINDQFRITCISLGSCHLLHRIFVPQSTRITECADTALGAHTGTRQYDQVLHFLLLSFIKVRQI